MIKLIHAVLLIGFLINHNMLAQTAINHKRKASESMNPYPFQISDDGQYTIIAAIESEELYNKYYPLFEKYGYEGNGYCWEGHIIQILEKNDSELLEHIEFDPEAGGFYAYADSKEAMEDFIRILSPIFSDINKLEEYIKSADRNRIDD